MHLCAEPCAAIEDLDEEESNDAADWLHQKKASLSLGLISGAFFEDRVASHVRTAFGDEYCNNFQASLRKAQRLDAEFCHVAINQCIRQLEEQASQSNPNGDASVAASLIVDEVAIWREALQLHIVRSSISDCNALRPDTSPQRCGALIKAFFCFASWTRCSLSWSSYSACFRRHRHLSMPERLHSKM